MSDFQMADTIIHIVTCELRCNINALFKSPRTQFCTVILINLEMYNKINKIICKFRVTYYKKYPPIDSRTPQP